MPEKVRRKQKLRYRTVEVEGQTFEVPTNVYWDKSKGRRCWRVSVWLDDQHSVENFNPSQYRGSLKAAFDAACKFADLKRKYPSKQLHVGGLPRSNRSLDGRPVLPRGIGFHARKRSRCNDEMVYQMSVYHEQSRLTSVLIGPVDGYTDEQYDRALRICKKALRVVRASRKTQRKQVEEFRQEVMRYTDRTNPFSHLIYSVEKVAHMRAHPTTSGDSHDSHCR